ESATKEDEDNSPPAQEVGKNDVLMLRFRKITCAAEGDILVSRSAQGVWNCDISRLATSVTTEINRALDIVKNDPERIRALLDPYVQIRVSERAMASPLAYEAFKKTLPTVVTPVWKWEMRSSV